MTETIITAPAENYGTPMWRVTTTSHEDGETWANDYWLKIDAERAVEAAEENENTATIRRVRLSI